MGASGAGPREEGRSEPLGQALGSQLSSCRPSPPGPSLRQAVLAPGEDFLDCPPSGDLEVTVDFLTEVDKLVQLIECPIFTCKALPLASGLWLAGVRRG